MYGLCGFLVTAPAKDAELRDALEQTIKSRYAAAHCGDDNWWHPIEAVRPSGELVSLWNGDGHDWKDGLARRFAAEHRWEEVLAWMLEETLADFVQLARGAAPTLRPHIESALEFAREGDIRDRVQLALPVMTKTRQRVAERVAEGRALDVVDRLTANLARIERLLRESLGGISPFSATLETPYVYRAFDVRTDPADSSNVMIYLVDMHT
jgi:hypothetical protein